MRHFTLAVASMFLFPVAAAAGPQTTADLAQCGGYPAEGGFVECACNGNETGSVWGSGPYTSDSDLCVAARHAGVIGAQGGPVAAFGVGGQDAYPGSTQNGVTTSTWGSFGSSFDFVRTQAGQACGAFPGGDAPYSCECTGTEGGTVWGSGPYTADSDLCAAARHAGVIGSRGGMITVLGIGGLDNYTASTMNNVTTHDWGRYEASVVFNRN